MVLKAITTSTITYSGNLLVTSGNVSFAGKNKNKKKAKKEIPYQYKDIKESYNSGLGLGIISTLAITLAGIMFQTGYDKKEAIREMHSFLNLVNSENIRKDTFMLKDVTNDDIPDIILYTKDGKNLVYDAAEKSIFKEVVVDKSIPVKPKLKRNKKGS